jgi:hypothetical protein
VFSEGCKVPPAKLRQIPIEQISFEASELVSWTDRLAPMAGQLDPSHVHLFGQLHPILVCQVGRKELKSWRGLAGVVSYTLARAVLPPKAKISVRDVSGWDEAERNGFGVADALLTPLLLSEPAVAVRSRLVDLLDSELQPELLTIFPKGQKGGDSYWAKLLGCSRQTLAKLRANKA